MSLKMYAQYKVLKKDNQTNNYKYLTGKDIPDLPFPGAFGFTINGDDIPFDFYESTTTFYRDDLFATIMGAGEFVYGDLTEDYDDVYEDMGISREDLTPEFLASVTDIYEFFLNFEDKDGDEFDAGTYEENVSDESLFRTELIRISFVDERGEEFFVSKEALDKFNGKF